MAKEKTKPDPGDLVLVSFASDTTNNPARKLHGQQFVVKTKRDIKGARGDGYIYTLYGAESDAGIPYSFFGDQLILI